MKKTILFLLVVILIGGFAASFFWKTPKAQTIASKLIDQQQIGDAVDSLNGVLVFYNGMVAHTGERHLATTGYNYGLRWQCVEFVKRYYYDFLKHSMPNTYGHAKDFFNAQLKDGAKNTDRGLIQYKNGSKTCPKKDDLLVFGAVPFNKYGHVAIVSAVNDKEIELIQQNPGPMAASRETYSLEKKKGLWYIDRDDLLGWLRKE